MVNPNNVIAAIVTFLLTSCCQSGAQYIESPNPPPPVEHYKPKAPAKDLSDGDKLRLDRALEDAQKRLLPRTLYDKEPLVPPL